MIKTIEISPLTRIEGHLAIHTDAETTVTEDGKSGFKIVDARCEGEMYRGFEKILKGRDPLDAQQITQRICGVCPISHGIASCQAQEMAYGIKPSHNGRLLQNLIWGANYLQSHILHFYTLSALDFIDVTALLEYGGKNRTLRDLKAWVANAVKQSEKGLMIFPAAPFLPRYDGDYIDDIDINCAFIAHYAEALAIRRIAHEMAAVFGARLPHSTALVPGGCTQVPTLERVLAYRARLANVSKFINEVYFPDVLTAARAFPAYWEIGKSPESFLAFGAFEMDNTGKRFFSAGTVINGQWSELDHEAISEHVRYSKFSSESQQHPSRSDTTADPDKVGAYTWVKAPRYKGHPMEVGPLARIMVMYHNPNDIDVRREVDALIKPLGLVSGRLNSVLGRHLARALEAKWLAVQCEKWIDEIELDKAPANDFDLPREASGYGLVEAPRGALGHWLTISDYKIKNYQCIVPTTWNCSPKDDNGVHGPVEQALIGSYVADSGQPLELARIVRSYDPCIACAVH